MPPKCLLISFVKWLLRKSRVSRIGSFVKRHILNKFNVAVWVCCIFFYAFYSFISIKYLEMIEETFM